MREYRFSISPQSSLSRLPRRPAAVHQQVLAGDVAAGVAGEQHDRALQLLGLAHAPKRHLLLQALDELGHAGCRSRAWGTGQG